MIGPGGDVASGPPVLIDTTVRETLRAGSPAGHYTVRWRVTSADGHPVSGSFDFTATAAGGDPSATAAASTGNSVEAQADGGGRSGWGALGLAAVVAIVVAVFAVTRRRRHSQPAPVGEEPQ